ncbi:MAG: hypothetical protein LBR83_08795 [Clostridiales bacterium]|nr:hypothetical protein [Clostridiales bacterium]
MAKDFENSRAFEALGHSFEITDALKAYNEVRAGQERRAFEIEERYATANQKMMEEFVRLAQPEADKFIASIRNNIQTLQQADVEGMNELINYEAAVLPEIGRHLVFKYTKNDAVTADDIGRILFAGHSELYREVYDGFFANIYDDMEKLESLRGNLAAKRELRDAARDEPQFSSVGFGFRGTVAAAVGAAAANAGMGLIRGFGDALGYASDISKVEKETLKGLDRAKRDLLIMGGEQFNKLRDVCREMLYKDMSEELSALDITPYKPLSEEQRRVISLKDENYGEAYREGDIGPGRYAAYLFGAMADDPYNIRYYCGLYNAAAQTGDEDAKADILSFAGFLGLDKPVKRVLEAEGAARLSAAAALGEDTIDEMRKKLSALTRLYGKEARAEAERVAQKIKSEEERLNKIAVLLSETAEKVRLTRKKIAKYQGRIGAGENITTFIKPDGTVGYAGGSKEDRETNVKHLKNAAAISSCGHNTAVLHPDGTASFGGLIGGTLFDRPDTSGWRDLTAVSAADYHCVGLRKNGTVMAQAFYHLRTRDYTYDCDDDGQCLVSEWKNIVAVSAGNRCTVGLRGDGTAVAAGALGFYDRDKKTTVKAKFSESETVSAWRGLAAVAAGNSHVVGLREDGSVLCAVLSVAETGHGRMGDWHGIVAVAAGFSHTVGLKWDGTVVAVGDNTHGQCNVSAWRDIVAIAATDNHTVGLKANGTLVAAGANKYGQCGVSSARVRMA